MWSLSASAGSMRWESHHCEEFNDSPKDHGTARSLSPTVPSPPHARILRFGTFLYSSSLPQGGKGEKKRRKKVRTVIQTFLMHFAEWQCNHHLLHFQIFIPENMSRGGNAKPLGWEMGFFSMIGSTSWQVFDQFNIFPKFSYSLQGGQDLSFFSYLKANKSKHWGFKTIFNVLYHDLLSYHSSVLYNVTASSTSDCILTPQKARICNRVLSLDMWSKYQQDRPKKAPIKFCSFSCILQKAIMKHFLTKGGTFTYRQLSDQRI